MRELAEPRERELDFRPAGRWGPSYFGRVRTKMPVTLTDEPTVIAESVGPMRRRWPLGRRFVWILRRALRLT